MEVPARAALLLDLASLDVMAGHHGVRVAPGRLRERLTEKRRMVRAVAYGVRDDDRPDSEQRLADLAAEGFKVVAKPALIEAADAVVEFANLLESVRSERPGRRDMPTERGNARPRLDPPPRRRSRRRSSGRSDAEAPTTAPAADRSEGTRDERPPAAGQDSEAVSESAPAEPSESTGGAPDRASPRVLPQESLSGRAVRASADEG